MLDPSQICTDIMIFRSFCETVHILVDCMLHFSILMYADGQRFDLHSLNPQVCDGWDVWRELSITLYYHPAFQIATIPHNLSVAEPRSTPSHPSCGKFLKEGYLF